MTFLNAMLLAGGAAFLVPLLIHLFNRRRVVTVRWGAMHLLHEVIRQRKRRLKIEQLLLLLTRIAIPIVLALCLARPVLSFLRQLPGLSNSSLIVVLDNSYSMRAPSENSTLIQRSRDDLSRILQTLPQGSDVQVLLAGGNPTPLLDEATSALDLLPDELRSMDAFAGPVNVQEALQQAIATARSSKNATREILVVSDFQKTDWKRLIEGGTVPALDQLANEDPAPVITFYQVAAELSDNLHFSSVQAAPAILAPGQPAGLRVRIQASGQQAWQDVAVHLEADGARVKTARASVPAGGETTLYFTHGFEDLGEHTLSVRIDGDSMLDDNVWHEQVDVRDQVRVLLLEGEPSSEPLEGALDFVELALAPHSGAKTSLRDLIETTRAEARRIKAEDLRGYAVIVMGDVSKFGRNDILKELTSFVENGGGLLVRPGDNASPADYTRDWFRDGQGILPSSATGQEHIASSLSPARLRIERFTHPALTYFNDARSAGLREVEIQHWWKLEPDTKAAQTLLSLDRGAPLLIEKAFGQGRVIFSAMTFDPEWSNLPLQPLFVPLAQRLVIHLAVAGGDNASTALIGQSLQRLIPATSAEKEYLFTAPDGKESAIAPSETEGRQVLTIPPSTTPGIGRIRSKANPDRPASLAIWNLDPAEGDLETYSESEVRSLAERLGIAYANNTEGYARMDRDRRLGAEIWQPLLALLLILLFFEVLLQQRITRA